MCGGESVLDYHETGIKNIKTVTVCGPIYRLVIFGSEPSGLIKSLQEIPAFGIVQSLGEAG